MIALTGFRYCPRCGRGGIREDRTNAMRCPACDFLYYHNCAAAVAGIIESPGGIVTVRRAAEPKRGFYDLPGGFVDYGETFEGALRREVKEELGIGIEEVLYFGSFPNRYAFAEVTYFTTDAVFTCRISGRDAEIRPNREIGKVEILPPRSIDLSAVAFDSIREALESYRESRNPSAR